MSDVLNIPKPDREEIRVNKATHTISIPRDRETEHEVVIIIERITEQGKADRQDKL